MRLSARDSPAKAREAQGRHGQRRRRAVEEQARNALYPKTSKCPKCEEADAPLQGESNLRTASARMCAPPACTAPAPWDLPHHHYPRVSHEVAWRLVECPVRAAGGA